MSCTETITNCSIAYPISNIGVMDSLVSVLLHSILIAQSNVSSSSFYPKDYSAEALANGLDDFDFVVVGSGTPGSVVASRLSENPHWKVLVLEAGGDPSPESEIPFLAHVLQYTDKSNDYFTKTNPHSCNAYRNSRCYISGGSSQLNNMLYLPANPRDYDRWWNMGNYGWSYKDVKPYFEKSIAPQGDSTHPKGYLKISKFEQYDDKYSLLLKNAVHELGQPIIKEFTKDEYLGYSYLKGYIENGRRMRPEKVYLGKVAARQNLKVMKNTQIFKIISDLQNNRIKSIKLLVNNKFILQINIRKELILAAGTYETPKLLMLSGIGPKAVLNTLNIPTIIDLPVGESLQDMVLSHVFVKLDATKQRTKQFEDNLYKYLMFNEGPMRSIGISSYVGFIKTVSNFMKFNSSNPDIQIQHELFTKNDILCERYLNGLAMKDELKSCLLEAIKTNDILVVSLNLLNPYSHGTLKLKSSFFLDAPIIEPNYLKDARDVMTLLEGIKYIAKMVDTAAFRRYNAKIIRMPLSECDFYPYKSNHYWKCYLKYFSTTGSNPVGTAKMGPRYDHSAVVTPRLMVKGMSNLRVVDQSVMPTLTSGCSNAPAVMVAEKASDFIKQDYNYLVK